MRHSLKPRALADMALVYAEGAERFGVDEAEAYAAGLTKTFEFLADFPRAARLRSELPRPVRVFRYKSHLILYDLGPDDRVLILRVVHGRSDWISDPL